MFLKQNHTWFFFSASIIFNDIDLVVYRREKFEKFKKIYLPLHTSTFQSRLKKSAADGTPKNSKINVKS